MEGGGVALWVVAVIVGPIILGAIIAFGRIRNRQRRKREAAAEARHRS